MPETDVRSSAREILRHLRRGLGPLPHVGSHPGLPVGAALVVAAAATGLATGDLRAAATSAALAAVLAGGLVAIGAVRRSRTSDRLSDRRPEIDIETKRDAVATRRREPR